jgi:hypothetical protein
MRAPIRKSVFGRVAWLGLVCLGLDVRPAGAQLEVLLRGLVPAPPRPGACGRYRFASEEQGGPRRLDFDACIERIDPGPAGSVWLRLVSGDSLEARVELAPEIFAGRGGSLQDHVRSVLEVTRGDTTRIEREDWATFRGLERAPALPGAQDSLLGAREIRVGSRAVECSGRRVRERAEKSGRLGDAQMTQRFERDVETWTAPTAPILGLVRARAEISTARTLSAPVKGVPQFGERHENFEIELLEILPSWRR